MSSDREALLDRCLTEGRAAWPAIACAETALRPAVAAQLAAGEAEPVEHLADLYLAAAAALGDPAAVTAVGHHIARIAREVARSIVGDGGLDELVQQIRVKILVGETGLPPRITAFAGLGPLTGWLRVVVLRSALSERRQKRPAEVAIDETAWLEIPVAMDDPLVAEFRHRHALAFREAFEAAVAALTRRERTLLRHHFIDGLSSEQLGRRFRVHRVTVFRWIAEVKRKVLDATRTELQARVGGTDSEIASVMRGVRSGFSVTIERVLALHGD